MRKEIGYIYCNKFLDHFSYTSHPEQPERVKVIDEYLKVSKIYPHMVEISPTQANFDTLSLVHNKRYIKKIEHYSTLAKDRNIWISSDTYANENTFKVAALAVGAVCTGIDFIFNEGLKYVFANIRPPGHHAFPKMGGGFCIFNNIAVGARYAQERYYLDKILILDWDVHHGNGTQKVFYKTNQVFYVSIHQASFYPFTGGAAELGEDTGKGYNRNFPVLPGTGDSEYRLLFEGAIKEIFENYKPKLVLISTGFDSHRDDPIGGIKLSSGMFRDMTSYIKNYSKGVPILSALEGGYNLDILGETVAAHLSGFIQE